MPWNCAPNSLRCAVVTGTSTVSSWSRPSRLWPRRLITPTTTNGAFLMRIVRPTGSSAPNRLSTTVWPSIATRVAPRTSESSNTVPSATPQDETSRYSGVVPLTCVPQLAEPYTTCALPGSVGAAASTPGSSAIAVASSSVSVGALPLPMRNPPCAAEPDSTMNRLLPIEAIDRLTESSTPRPIASIRITAATPMTMPSIVSAARMRLAAIAANASRSIANITTPSGTAPAPGRRTGPCRRAAARGDRPMPRHRARASRPPASCRPG